MSGTLLGAWFECLVVVHLGCEPCSQHGSPPIRSAHKPRPEGGSPLNSGTIKPYELITPILSTLCSDRTPSIDPGQVLADHRQLLCPQLFEAYATLPRSTNLTVPLSRAALRHPLPNQPQNIKRTHPPSHRQLNNSTDPGLHESRITNHEQEPVTSPKKLFRPIPTTTYYPIILEPPRKT